ncbi:mannanase [uncultured Sphingomonas sp.]|uniref:glycoside hydrolase 5 family protein n=1 Tax=uncultured Sphingomonas sp. TaxID=158754 RepID=UPI0035CBD354
MVTRRQMLATGAVATAALATPAIGAAAGDARFVRRVGTSLRLGDKPYRFVGANIWYGAYLGADAAFGDRERLRRELDAMAALGITNLRVLASSELSPLRNSITPTFRGPGKDYNETLFGGLDFLLAEMAKRGLRAVLYVGNFWEWSGGMMTYLSYVNGGKYIDMNDPAHPWPEFADMASQFYGNPAAVALYRDYVRTVVGRTNRSTGTAYADDPTIMAWQLANEPRPGGGVDVAIANLPAFYRWVRDTAALIKTIDRNHLVSTGSEGLKGCIERADIVEAEHRIDGIDYLTSHVWPLNWTWVDAKNLAGTYDAGAAKVQDYIDAHIAIATRLGKPLVIEEFGYPRDGGSYAPTASTAFKDRFYRQVYASVLASAKANGPVAGSNFWAWSGEGRAAHPDFKFQRGDRSYVGDPPHEPQGWYGVFSTDRSTQQLIREHATALAATVTA